MAQPVERVELHGALPGLERCLEGASAVLCPGENAFMIVTERHHRPGKRRAGIERQRMAENLARVPVPGSAHALLQRKRLQRQIPGTEMLGPGPQGTLLLGAMDL